MKSAAVPSGFPFCHSVQALSATSVVVVRCECVDEMIAATPCFLKSWRSSSSVAPLSLSSTSREKGHPILAPPGALKPSRDEAAAVLLAVPVRGELLDHLRPGQLLALALGPFLLDGLLAEGDLVGPAIRAYAGVRSCVGRGKTVHVHGGLPFAREGGQGGVLRLLHQIAGIECCDVLAADTPASADTSVR
jgi:hypothetical protein